jgi:hypothetical protein
MKPMVSVMRATVTRTRARLHRFERVRRAGVVAGRFAFRVLALAFAAERFFAVDDGRLRAPVVVAGLVDRRRADPPDRVAGRRVVVFLAEAGPRFLAETVARFLAEVARGRLADLRSGRRAVVVDVVGGPGVVSGSASLAASGVASAAPSAAARAGAG